MMNEWYRANNNSMNSQGKDYKAIKRTRIIAIIILCLTIVVAIVLIVTNKNTSNNSSPYSSSDSTLPDDYKEFFNGFYKEVNDETADIKMPEYKEETSFRVELIKSTSDDLSLQKLYNVCQNQIVSIRCSTDGEIDDIWASGVILSDDGLILTNTHVIDGCKKATVILTNGNEYESQLVGADVVTDLAVLKIASDEQLSPAEFADISDLMVGDEVVAIGSPLGSAFINTLTNGIVSGIERDIPSNGHSTSLIQTNAALNEGNSGGALFNMKGQVIGITNMKMNSITVSIEGIGFAIPSTTVKTITDSLLSKGFVQRTTIGVVVGSIPDNVSKAYSLPNGLYVTDVNDGSGAYDAGIKVGDVITKVNDTDIKTTSDVNEIKDTMSAGDIMKITVFREGDYIDFDVLLK